MTSGTAINVPIVTSRWDEASAVLREKAYRKITSEPYAKSWVALEVVPDIPAKVDRPDFRAVLAFLIYKQAPLGNGRSAEDGD